VFEDEADRKKRSIEGKPYLLGGLFPLVYKYITGFKNLTNYRDIDEIEDSSDRMKDVMNQFTNNADGFSRITGMSKDHFSDEDLQNE